MVRIGDSTMESGDEMRLQVDDALETTLAAARSGPERASVLMEYMERRGQARYDESVTQLEHALQCACLARQAGAPAEGIVAALLHDIGHFITSEQDPRSNFHVEDWCHENLGADCLAPFMVEPVIAAIRLHVLAKRYLCTTNPDYTNGLSPASQRSLRLQGGLMAADEVVAFEKHLFHHFAIAVRRWDDGAKVAGWNVPLLQSYRSDIEASMIP
jgi:predicted HD phosphohydrolase